MKQLLFEMTTGAVLALILYYPLIWLIGDPRWAGGLAAGIAVFVSRRFAQRWYHGR
jgi:hypothetical protein